MAKRDERVKCKAPPAENLPLVILTGRVNVGKSTLFNALVGRRRALQDAIAGVTRDILMEKVEWLGNSFFLCDTPGVPFPPYPSGAEGKLVEKMAGMLWELYSRTSLFVLLLDARTGILPYDRELWIQLKKLGKPMLIAVNKVEDGRGREALGDFYSLQGAPLFFVSAMKKLGLGELLDAILEKLSLCSGDQNVSSRGAWEEMGSPSGLLQAEASSHSRALKLLLLGGQNVGKSTLFNALCGKEMALVSDLPGTTRDWLEGGAQIGRAQYTLVDTAGMKRKQSKTQLEYAALRRSLEAAKRADALLFVLDAKRGITRFDRSLAREMLSLHKPHLFLVNKWDCVQEPNAEKHWLKEVWEAFPQLRYGQTLFVSGAKGWGLEPIADAAQRAYSSYCQRIPTAQLNVAFQKILRTTPPYPVKLRYLTQARTAPPTFLVFGRQTGKCPRNYLRYLEKCLREIFDFSGSPLLVLLREERASADRQRLRQKA